MTTTASRKKTGIIMGSLALAAVVILLLGIAGVIPLFRADAAPFVAEMKMKLTLPADIDSVTRLNDIRAEKDRVIYEMTLLSPREEALNRTDVMMRYLDDRACKSETYLKLLNERLTVVLDYKDIDGEALQTITILPDDCAKKEAEPK